MALMLVNPADAAATHTQLREVEEAARSMGLQVQFHDANSSKDIDAAFEAIVGDKPDAVFILTSPFFNGRRIQLCSWQHFTGLPQPMDCATTPKPAG